MGGGTSFRYCSAAPGRHGARSEDDASGRVAAGDSEKRARTLTALDLMVDLIEMVGSKPADSEHRHMARPPPSSPAGSYSGPIANLDR